VAGNCKQKMQTSCDIVVGLVDLCYKQNKK